MTQQDHIRDLINRLARMDASEAWVGDLNPSQRSVLDYLSRANRFSRNPSQVADYLGSTRGTVSQTLKSLGKKGYVVEARSDTDKRAIKIDLTIKGRNAILLPNSLALGLGGLPPIERGNLIEALSNLLSGLLRQNDRKPFGICQSCVHFSPRGKNGFCTLLSETLTEREITKICHEQVPA